LLTFSSIVAVHGLNGDAFKTWTAQKTKKFWLGDLDMLPANLEDSRILTYSYNATVAAICGKTSSDRIMQHAHTLIAELVADRQVLFTSSESILSLTAWGFS
jgi:protein SERAC1